MKRGSISNFLNPKTIAVVGASDNPQKVGGVLMNKLVKFTGKIIPVNINRDIVLGIKCYRKVDDYPGEIDMAIIAIPAKTVPYVLEDCGKKRIKNIIVISSGFSEVENFKPEKQISNIVKRYNMNLLGPNCFGIANPYLNLDSTFSNTAPKKGNIAFLSQSGALWSYISDYSSKKIGFSGFVSLGNMVDLDFTDFIKYFSKDKKTKKIILYIEKLKDGRRFIEICRKCKKEIIAVKAGKSEKGSKAALSHTGSLATDFEIYKGAFKQANVKLADSLASAFNLPETRTIPFKIKGKKAVILTNAGGAGALGTDYLEENRFKLVKAPIDLLGTALAEDYESALNKLKDKKFYDFAIVILTPQKMSEPEKTAEVIVKFSKHRKIIACFLGDKSIKKAKQILEKNKIPCFTQIRQIKKII